MIDTRIRLSTLPSPHLFAISIYLPYGDSPGSISDSAFVHNDLIQGFQEQVACSVILISFSNNLPCVKIYNAKFRNYVALSCNKTDNSSKKQKIELQYLTLWNVALTLKHTLENSEGKTDMSTMVQEPQIHLGQIMSWFHPGEKYLQCKWCLSWQYCKCHNTICKS